MAVPILIGAAAVAAAAFGAKKHYDASEMTDKARRLVRNAQAEFEEERDRFLAQKEALTASLEDLAAVRKNAEVKYIGRFCDVAEKITRINYSEIRILAGVPDVEIPTVVDLDREVSAWADLPTTGAKGVAMGLMGAAGASSLATSIGVASTGTAISSLSGVAATNATLAWLGGGSLAAGGFGMAGGMAVLGGAVVGPLVAITGFTAAKNAEKNLTKAYEKEAEIEEMTEQARVGQAALGIIQDRTNEIASTITRFVPYMQGLTEQLAVEVRAREIERDRLQRDAEERRAAYAQLNVFIRFFNWLFRRTPRFDFVDPLDFNNFPPAVREGVSVAFAAVKTLKQLIEINIIDEAGAVTRASEEAVCDATAAVEGRRPATAARAPTVAPAAAPARKPVVQTLLKVAAGLAVFVVLAFAGLLWLGSTMEDEGGAAVLVAAPVAAGTPATAPEFQSIGMPVEATADPAAVPAPVAADAQASAVPQGDVEATAAVVPVPEPAESPSPTAATPASATSRATAQNAGAPAAAPAAPPAVSPAPVAGVNTVAIERMVARAEMLMREGRAQEAVTVANNILAFDPANSAALRIRQQATVAAPAGPRW